MQSNAFVASLGAKLHTRLEQAEGTLVPSARLGVAYDLAADEVSTTGRFVGGGAAFKVKGAKVQPFSGNAGVGMTFENPVWSVGAAYDATFKSGYRSHTAVLETRLKF